MSKHLFNEFEPVSAKQWKQKIQVELKGADYNETLVWQSLEGIHVKPFYHPDDFEKGFSPIPGHPASWRVAQTIFIDAAAIAKKLAVDAIERGAEAIFFSASTEFDIEATFSNFPFEKAEIHLHFSFLSEDFLLPLKQFFSEKKATVYFHIDTIAHLARTGNWFYNLQKDQEILTNFLHKYPTEHVLSIDTSLYQNAGATMVQQLAYALAHANEYLHQFASSLSPAKNILPVTFKVSAGSNYFFEIAKIRALRKLYAVLANEYGVEATCHIIAMPSKRNKTLYDYNVNMLRTTTECMSAVLGGANTVANLAYDAIYHKSNEFGERISRNQLLILKSESYFNTAANAADGTYYIETLTDALAEKALVLFKDIEKQGGFLKELKEGTIQRKIKESAAKEQELFDEGKIKLLGTNFQKNLQEKMKDELELFPFVKTNIRKTLIAPILEKRLAEKTEQERLKNEEAAQ